MALQHATWLAGEVHCLNCGAILAEVVRGEDENRLGLRPIRAQSVMQVEIVGQHALRCRRCNGRALVALFDDPIEERQVEIHSKRSAIACLQRHPVVSKEA